ncbi:MAG: sigma 54-interacting transcriptional regulator [Bacteroidota bacterium]
MRKALVSWIAWYYDFEGGEVNLQGPTFDVHEHFYDDHEKHLILSSGPKGDIRSELLYTRLKHAYPNRQIELKYTDVQDVYDFRELRIHAERALESLKEYETDILFSNGTTPMRLVWLILHLEKNGYHTRLIQGKDPEMAEEGNRFPEIQADTSLFTQGIRIRKREEGKTERSLLTLQKLLPLYKKAEQIAEVDGITTLLEGESGSGKEVMARYIHAQSARSKKAMVSVNCAALGDDLLESRLFGYKKGAFTGAEKDTQGLMQAADQGTIFLDEIGDISPYMQVSLLRVLQERNIRPVGSTEEIPIDVRIIAATNKSLRKACEKGTFRWDLYYRLTQTRLSLPAFRQYPAEDREAFFHHFLLQKAETYQRPLLTLSPEIRKQLLSYSFPGNIRELENLITHFYVFCTDGMIQRAHMPSDLNMEKEENLSLEHAKATHIRKIIDLCHGNHTQAMELLDISRNTLKKYV